MLSEPLLYSLRLRAGLGPCGVEAHYGTVKADLFLPSFLPNKEELQCPLKHSHCADCTIAYVRYIKILT